MTLMRVVDAETTGMEPPAEVIEWGWCDFERDTLTISGGDSYLCWVKENPADARGVHHIYTEDVIGCPSWDADKVLQFALDSDVVAFVAHMASFEAKWLGRTIDGVLPLLCTYKAALRMWPDAPSHGNMALVYWLADQGKATPERLKLQPAHRALPDAYGTAHILKALYESGMTGAMLAKWSREPALLPRCPIGEHRGKPWAEVDSGFLRWIVDKQGMEYDTQFCAQTELNRRLGQ